MPDVTTFNLGGQDITVKDPTARSNAQSANTAATEAATTANKALKKVEEVEKLFSLDCRIYRRDGNH